MIKKNTGRQFAQKKVLIYIECFLFEMRYTYLAHAVTDLKRYVDIGFLFKASKYIR